MTNSEVIKFIKIILEMDFEEEVELERRVKEFFLFSFKVSKFCPGIKDKNDMHTPFFPLLSLLNNQIMGNIFNFIQFLVHLFYFSMYDFLSYS